MNLSVFDFFKIGIGPSSSHTMGPMRAAKQFVTELKKVKKFGVTKGIQVELYGSLALTGAGHGTPAAIKMGLQGKQPEEVSIKDVKQASNQTKSIKLGGIRKIDFTDDNIQFKNGKTLPFHSNGMKFTSTEDGPEFYTRTYYSIGGGFVVTEKNAKKDKLKESSKDVPNQFASAKELADIAKKKDVGISDIILENEMIWRKKGRTHLKLKQMWKVMRQSVDRGLTTTGTLPGSLKLARSNCCLSKPGPYLAIE